MKNLKSFNDFVNEDYSINEAKKEIKPYTMVEPGDMAMENPDAGGEWDNELGKILWVGTAKDLMKNSKYKDLAKEWDYGYDDIEDYDLVVVDLKGSQGGPTLFNYNNDPSGCVVFESKGINEGHPSNDPYAYYDSMDQLELDLKQTLNQWKGQDMPEWAKERVKFLEDGIKNKVRK